MPIKLIAATSENNVIGKDGGLPWHMPEDMKRFKNLTMGHVVLMGRKTWESIPEKYRPLPGRINAVVTRTTDYPLPPDVKRFPSIEEAVRAYPTDIIFVIGGGEIYRQTIGLADTIHLTRVHQEINGDTFFPDIDPRRWKETAREDHDGFSFLTYERNG